VVVRVELQQEQSQRGNIPWGHVPGWTPKKRKVAFSWQEGQKNSTSDGNRGPVLTGSAWKLNPVQEVGYPCDTNRSGQSFILLWAGAHSLF
jgi:hypothetical protein